MSNKSEEKKFELKPIELEPASEQNKRIIPTLFNWPKPDEKKREDRLVVKINDKENTFTVNVKSISEPYVLEKALKAGMIFNAILPAFSKEKEKYTYAKNENAPYTYAEKANSEHTIVFKLPKEKKTKILFMELCEAAEGDASRADTFVATGYLNEKTVKFNMSLKEYEGLWISKDEHRLVCLYDEAKGRSYLFECWTEYLPIPGEGDGVFAYTDGSSRTYNQDDSKDGYGTGYVISKSLKNGEKEIQFGHTESEEPESNFEAEMEAVTNVLKNILEDIKAKRDLDAYQNLTIYFDNNQVGFYPARLNAWLKNGRNINLWALKYGKTFAAYFGLFNEADMKCNIKFIHVQSHFGAFGNEMADRLAQINDSELSDEDNFVKGYVSNRKNICPEGGQFSASSALLKP